MRATGTLATIAQPVGWAFAWWGTALYWVAGILYAVQLRQLHRGAEDADGAGMTPPAHRPTGARTRR